MDEAKIVLTILSMIGVPAYVLAIILNISNYKSDILFYMGGVFLLIRVGFFISRQLHLTEMRKLELEKEKMIVEKLKREQKLKNKT